MNASSSPVRRRVVRSFLAGVSTAALLLASASPPVLAAAVADMDADGHAFGDCAPLDPTVHPGAPDLPDLSFSDTNCDGIDGDASSAIFVAPAGSDDNVGSQLQPFQTIQKGITVAKAGGHQVYAAVGSYDAITIPDATYNGIQIYGGYQAGTWSRTTAFETVISGQPAAAVVVVAQDVVFQLVTLEGAPTANTGASAYGLRAAFGAEVALIGSELNAAAGATGYAGNGSTRPAKPPTAAGGSDGTCNAGGAGGDGAAPSFYDKGGAGGAGGEETNDGENGEPGDPGIWNGFPTGGTGGGGGIDQPGDPALTPEQWAALNGQVGGAGPTGGNGGYGSGGSGSLSLASSIWIGLVGSGGTIGGDGGGGGGGGGGAGRGAWDAWAAGGGGGQGGHGGLGGGPGSGGGFGGGSFGLYLHGSDAVLLEGTTVTAGNGAPGGTGGNGAPGGYGGDGGQGGAFPTNCNKTAGEGGDGGPGGPGGNGGAGGGGAGGPSAAIFRVASSTSTVAPDVTLAHGTGGSGGSSAGNAGAQGQAADVLGPADLDPHDFDGDSIVDAGDACAATPRGVADADADGCPDAPQTQVTSGPVNGSFVLSTSATFRVASNESSSTFTCQVDTAAGGACSSPKTYSGLAQRTHVFRSWATDPAGDEDPSAAAVTWTVPVNNTALGHSSGWRKKTGSGYYLGKYSQSKKKGARLSRSVSGMRELALVATRGPGHGIVKVFLGTKLLKKVSLAAARVQKKRLIPIATFATAKKGTVKVVVASANKVVRIEGLGVETTV